MKCYVCDLGRARFYCPDCHMPLCTPCIEEHRRDGCDAGTLTPAPRRHD